MYSGVFKGADYESVIKNKKFGISTSKLTTLKQISRVYLEQPDSPGSKDGVGVVAVRLASKPSVNAAKILRAGTLNTPNTSKRSKIEQKNLLQSLRL